MELSNLENDKIVIIKLFISERQMTFEKILAELQQLFFPNMRYFSQTKRIFKNQFLIENSSSSVSQCMNHLIKDNIYISEKCNFGGLKMHRFSS